MNTVGYGDYAPQNDIERSFCILFIYIACGVFAYTLNTIGNIIQEISQQKRHFLYNVMLMNQYMNQKKINIDLRTRIRKYLEYVWEEEHQASKETSDIIEKLSTSLKEELLLETNGKILQTIPFFLNFSEKTLRKLTFKFKEVHYMPGDIIFQKGEYQSPSLFLLSKGRIELFFDLIDKEITQTVQIIKPGQSFGEWEFITGLEHEISAKSTSFSSVFMLDLDDFLKVLSENSDDYIKFREVRDKALLNNDLEGFLRYCEFCKDKNHSVLDCPLLHLKLLKPRIIQKFCYYKPNERKEFKRGRKKMNARKRLRFFQYMATNLESETLFMEEENDSSDYYSKQDRSSDMILRAANEKRDMLNVGSSCNEDINMYEQYSHEDDENSSENNQEVIGKSEQSPNHENKNIFEKDISSSEKKEISPRKKNTEKRMVSSSEFELFVSRNKTEDIIKAISQSSNYEISSHLKNLNLKQPSCKKMRSSNSLSPRPAMAMITGDQEKMERADAYLKERFDKPKEYMNYFPHNNLEAIVQSYNEYISKKDVPNILRRNQKLFRKGFISNTKELVYRHSVSKSPLRKSKSHFFGNMESKVEKSLDRNDIIKLLRTTKTEKGKQGFLRRGIRYVLSLLRIDE